jgi:hypothetical protein
MLQIGFPQAYLMDLEKNTPDLIIISNENKIEVAVDRLETDVTGRIINRVALRPSACIALFASLVGSKLVHALTMSYDSQINFDQLAFQLVFHTEPVTMKDAVDEARAYAILTSNTTLFQQQLRNAVRAQATPELQASFADTTISLDGAGLADVLSLPCGHEMAWDGDRELTLSYYFKGLEDFLAVMGGRSLNGWQIPPLGLSSTGRKRVRRKENGYLLPFFKRDDDTGCIKFGLEACNLKVHIPLGFFASNLRWFKGAEPVLADGSSGKFTVLGADDRLARRKFDMVTRNITQENFTIKRVEDHFYDE